MPGSNADNAAPRAPLAPLVLSDEMAVSPTPSRQTAFAPQHPPMPVVDEPMMPAAPFIPPQAERPIRPTRMPRVEDLPMPAQNQLRATRADAEAAAHHDQRRMSLLQRLATVGLGRKDQPAAHPAPAERPAAPVHRPGVEGPQRPSASPVHAEYTKRGSPQGYRPAQGGLDAHGRAPGQHKSIEDEQLEIPAFLRRQTN
jgi:cell division protein FtsZ